MISHSQSTCMLRLCTIGLMTLGTGCQSSPPRRMIMPPPPPRAVLAAAPDGTVNSFGELPGVAPGPFLSEMAVSLRQHSDPSEGSDSDPSITPDGRLVVFSSTRHSLNPNLYYKLLDGVAVTQLTGGPWSDIQPAVSPDGRRVAFASDRSGNWDIWIVNLDGQQPVQVTSSAAHEIHPSWSPGGDQLVFCSMPPRGGQWELWIASAKAAAVRKSIGKGLFPEWGPKSDIILYQKPRHRGSRWFSLWTVRLVNGEPRMPTEVASSPEHAMILPSWSPDQRQIAYCEVGNAPGMPPTIYHPRQRSDLWMVDVDGRGKVRLTSGRYANYAPEWSTDGRIYFTSDHESPLHQERLWSVVPLRAALDEAEPLVQHEAGQSDEERARPILESLEQQETRIETAAFPAEE